MPPRRTPTSAFARPAPGALWRPSRRDVLRIGGGATATTLLAGCGGFSTSDDSDTSDGAGASDTLTFLTWAEENEEKGYQALAAAFTEKTGVKVKLQVVPYSEVLTAVDTGLASDQPPDVFRVSYTDVAAYRVKGVLADIGDAEEMVDALLPAFKATVVDDEGLFGVPQHTDTSMVLVNTAAAKAAGIGRLPQSLADAWTWEEFADAGRRLRDAATAKRYAFAVNWSDFGAYRWLNWVDQAGGRLLDESLDKTVLAEDEGALKALDFTRSFFAEKLVPPDNTTKGTPASDLFTNETVAMCFAGDFLLAFFADVPFEFEATFLPRDVRASADLGGNALVAAKDSPRVDSALEFVRFCGERQQMADFCATANVLPTRRDIDPASLEFAVRPDLMPLFVEQASTISQELTEQVVGESFTAVNAALANGLETALTSSGDVKRAAEELAAEVQDALDR